MGSCTANHSPRLFWLQVVNADVPERDLWTVVLGSAAVSQQLATVVAAVSVPVHLRLGLMTGHTLLLLNVLMLLTGEPGPQTHVTRAVLIRQAGRQQLLQQQQDGGVVSWVCMPGPPGCRSAAPTPTSPPLTRTVVPHQALSPRCNVCWAAVCPAGYAVCGLLGRHVLGGSPVRVGVEGLDRSGPRTGWMAAQGLWC